MQVSYSRMDMGPFHTKEPPRNDRPTHPHNYRSARMRNSYRVKSGSMVVKISICMAVLAAAILLEVFVLNNDEVVSTAHQLGERAEGFQALAKVEVCANGQRILATLNVVDDASIVGCGELGLSEDAFAQFGAADGVPVVAVGLGAVGVASRHVASPGIGVVGPVEREARPGNLLEDDQREIPPQPQQHDRSPARTVRRGGVGGMCGWLWRGHGAAAPDVAEEPDQTGIMREIKSLTTEINSSGIIRIIDPDALFLFCFQQTNEFNIKEWENIVFQAAIMECFISVSDKEIIDAKH